MLALIANTMESSVFFALNSFFGDTYKKEDGIERIEESANSRVSQF